MNIKNHITFIKNDLIKFCQELIQIKSVTCHEEEICKVIYNKMLELGYDEVKIDKLGNVIGKMGNGEKSILFDSHVDTVQVEDCDQWDRDPFSGLIKDDFIYGRGSVDMKGALAASIYAGYVAKKLKLLKGKSMYVSASVMEEDYDGEALYHEIREMESKPLYAVICEPSSCKLSLGQRGRALMKIDIKGVSAHGSAPEKGVNPVYKMAEIIKRIEVLGQRYMKMSVGQFNKPSIALTKIECETASFNAIPSKASIYVDRRLIKGETYEIIKDEMNEIIKGTKATWDIFKVTGESWTGEKVVLESFMPYWDISVKNHLTKKAIDSYKEINDDDVELMIWDFSTNGVATDKLNIPTIGFGPGDPKMAHMKNEHCSIEEITKACNFYTNLIKNI